MPLKVIDGTPTAISKFLREEEEKKKCPKCGSENVRPLVDNHPDTVRIFGGPYELDDYECLDCGAFIEGGHEKKVEGRNER